MTALNLLPLPKDATEPPPGSIVMTGMDAWVHLVAPGRDGWYRVGGGRPATLLWEDLHDPDNPAWLAVSSAQLAAHRDVRATYDDGTSPA